MSDAALDARGLVRTYDDGTGVRGVDIRVAAGEIHALVGLNGAGKTTLMRLLLDMLKPTSGTVTIAGRSLDRTDWSAVGHLIDYPLAYRELTCRQNLALGARLHGVPPAMIPGIVEASMTELQLTQYADRRVSKLSLGNKQRLGIASALQHHPRIIVLDEPTNTLDPAGVILLREALLRRAAAGAALLVSSHHLDEVARIGDRISVMNAGRIIGSLDPHGVDIERSFFDIVHSDQDAA
ncbi:ATP-binding cassette domain-containing protein [Kribbella shirazensis]|uniref:ABC-2 type transport system ATP-binding protein n=1 Tax=Kribbella shirazensis TaxID=1105143 RepID=A0A7X5VDH7_9ACTN|nr:ABC-2 type transport system ATP-binding protein [Kribbella shirazensis]